MTPGAVPVIIGVGQLRANREGRPEAAREPLELILDAVGRAGADAGTTQLLDQVDDLSTVNVVSWAYDDLPGRVAEKLGARPRRSHSGPPGGESPVRPLDEAAARIASGESKLANALRAEFGQSIEEAQTWCAALHSRFTRIAATNDAAWDPVERSAEEIATVSGPNGWSASRIRS